jgi:hypothetical protein
LEECCFTLFHAYLSINEYDEDYVKEQMECIGSIGRYCPLQSLSLLNKLLVDKLQILSKLNSNTPLESIWDDFETLLTFCGYLLSDDPTCEVPLIPEQFILLTLADKTTNNPLLLLFNNILQYADFESQMLESKKSNVTLFLKFKF